MNRWMLSIILLLCLAACRKKDADGAHPADSHHHPTENHQLTDFYLMPVRDVTWKIHCQGSYVGGPGGYVFDTNFHFHYVVTSRNQDTLTNGKRYWKYAVSVVQTYQGGTVAPWQLNGTIYMREDTATNSVYVWKVIGNVTYPPEYDLAHFNEQVGDTLYNSWTGQPFFSIESMDSVLVANQYLHTWTRRFALDNSVAFYQGIGIGGARGLITGDILGNGSRTRTMDFFYKNDSLRISF